MATLPSCSGFMMSSQLVGGGRHHGRVVHQRQRAPVPRNAEQIAVVADRLLRGELRDEVAELLDLRGIDRLEQAALGHQRQIAEIHGDQVGAAGAAGLQLGDDLLVRGDEGRLEIDVVVLEEGAGEDRRLVALPAHPGHRRGGMRLAAAGRSPPGRRARRRPAARGGATAPSAPTIQSAPAVMLKFLPSSPPCRFCCSRDRQPEDPLLPAAEAPASHRPALGFPREISQGWHDEDHRHRGHRAARARLGCEELRRLLRQLHRPGSHRRRHHRARRGGQRPGGDPRNRRDPVVPRPRARVEGCARRPRCLRMSRRSGTSCTTRPAITAGAAWSSMRSARSTSRSGTSAARRPASQSSRCSARSSATGSRPMARSIRSASRPTRCGGTSIAASTSA